MGRIWLDNADRVARLFEPILSYPNVVGADRITRVARAHLKTIYTRTNQNVFIQISINERTIENDPCFYNDQN